MAPPFSAWLLTKYTFVPLFANTREASQSLSAPPYFALLLSKCTSPEKFKYEFLNAMAVVLLHLNAQFVIETSVEMISNIGPVYLVGVELSSNIYTTIN